MWTGYRDKQGYGAVWFQGRMWLAHRVAWVKAHGPIPEGLCVLHHCDNPPCCEAEGGEHLFLGTKADNSLDMAAKKRCAVTAGEANARARLTAVQVLEIRESDDLQRVLAERYGVSVTQINYIRRGHRWSSLA